MMALCLMAWCPRTLMAQPVEGDVVVTECSEVYEFKKVDGRVVIKNKISTTYRNQRDYRYELQPAVFYGDNITLDKSSCTDHGRAQYRSATPENVFYDDSKVCYYSVFLSNKNRECKATFERTFTDPRYFTRVLLGEEFPVKHKSVTFIIPRDMGDYRLIEKNFTPAIRVERSEKDGRQVITYTVTDLPAMKHESNAPLASSVYPVIFVVGPFKDYNDMFAWSRQLSDVDTTIPRLNDILAAINQGSKSELDKIRNTFAWVQENVRYVAFEAGVSKHQPDKPAEVVRKRYGDCKGMALLLKTLLVAQGFDARLTDVGTREASCRMSEIPTLAAVNHAICTLEWQGKTYYLDATANHIPLGHIPSNVQGMEVAVEQPDGKASLRTVPVLPVATNCDSMHVAMTLTPDMQLMGKASRHLHGDLKEMVLSMVDASESDERQKLENHLLNDNDHSKQVTDVTWQDKNCRSEWAVLTGSLQAPHSVECIEGEVYVAMDPDNMVLVSPIDTTKRKNDYLLPFPCRQVREVTLTLPAGYQCESLPDDFELSDAVADLSCSVRQEGEKVIYRKAMTLRQPHIARDYIPTWNSHLKQWHERSHEQIVLKKQ